MDAAPPIHTATQGRVGWITLHRPQRRNALNDALMDALGAALLAFDADTAIGAIVITGGDRAFAAGADIDAMANASYMDVVHGNFITRNWETIRQVRKPVLAAVAGPAMGGGCELALACDLRVCGEGARLGQPEVGLGILPGAGACYRLPRLVGPGVAKELIFTGRVIDAAEARAIGLVNRVVPDGEVLDVARAIAAEIARNSALAVRLAKSALNLAHEGSTDALQAFECTAQAVLFEDEEKRRRMTAFLEKRAHRRPTLAVGGLCEAPVELGREELARLPEADQVPDVGALVPGKKGRGVKLTAVLRAARPKEEVTHVALSSSDGKARASLTLEEAAQAVVVYALREQALTEDQGGPFRLLLPPGGDACRNVKHVAKVELGREAAGDLCGHSPEQHAKMRGA